VFDVEALLGWYARVRRPLPWRATRDPYALLVSEVMLQQTQAARVAPYYEAFLARFPDPAALAAAPPRAVLAAWSGLGYNRRALALQAAARVIAARGWPDDLTELPGIGPYTAAAVGSFAWDRPQAAIDTNARRVIARFDGVERRPAALSARAAELVPPGRAADFNQAMMELGATVCRPRAPRCGECPVREGCATRRAGGPDPAAPRERAGGAASSGRGAGGAASSRRGAGGAASSSRRGAGRFEDSDRWARGRILAALVAGEPLPPVVSGPRRARALAGLERDGLVVIAADGTPGLPT
jgi:A/G-specific adenine glycosylase